MGHSRPILLKGFPPAPKLPRLTNLINESDHISHICHKTSYSTDWGSPFRVTFTSGNRMRQASWWTLTGFHDDTSFTVEGLTVSQELSAHVLLWVSCDVGLTEFWGWFAGWGLPGRAHRSLPCALGKALHHPKGVVDPEQRERIPIIGRGRGRISEKQIYDGRRISAWGERSFSEGCWIGKHMMGGWDQGQDQGRK